MSDRHRQLCRRALVLLTGGLTVVGCGEGPVDSPIASVSAAVTAKETPAATCVTIQRGRAGAVADAYIKANALRANFGAQPVLRVSAKDEALLAFDVSSIPQAAVVTGATLKLYVNGDYGRGTIRVHRILAPWSESTVTFASFRQRFAPEAVGEFRVESRTALKNIDLKTLAAGWVRGQQNYGVLLDEGPDHHATCDRDGDEDRDPTLFVSTDAATSTKRPALEVCYTLPANHCAPSPCRNGGTCANRTDGYSCTCPPGWSGSDCGTNVDDCATSPCLNGGLCTDGVAARTCACPPGFDGSSCERNVDDCATNPCANGGVCTDGVAAFTCACAPGYDGPTCDHFIDDCLAAPCHNGATCTSRVNGYTCACAPGYSGPNCDTNVDDCVGNACVNGTCVDGLGAYECVCAPDWGGARCDVNLNKCSQNPCLNGATCVNGDNEYRCTCASGFTGTNCEIDVDDCAPNPCQNGGLCVDGVNAHACTCAPGHAGSSCEQVVCAGAPDGAVCSGAGANLAGVCQAGACCARLDAATLTSLAASLDAAPLASLNDQLTASLLARNPLKPMACDQNLCVPQLGCSCLARSSVEIVGSTIVGPRATTLTPVADGVLRLAVSLPRVLVTLRVTSDLPYASNLIGTFAYEGVVVSDLFDVVTQPGGAKKLRPRAGYAMTADQISTTGFVELNGFIMNEILDRFVRDELAHMIAGQIVFNGDAALLDPVSVCGGP